jgi:deoxycytidylate deaminase
MARDEEIGGPDATELIVALVAAVGTDLGMIVDQVRIVLNQYGFETIPLRLSDYLAEEAGESFVDKPFDEAVWNAMTAGDELREAWGRGDALALHAITDIAATRYERAGMSILTPAPEDSTGSAELPPPLDRVAFVLRSLKTQDELSTLRAVYGPRLVVIGAFSPKEERIAQLRAHIEDSRGTADESTWTHVPEEIIERDEKEEEKRGQDVSGTFHRADFFIRGSSRDVVREDLDRTVEILFGSPFRTPTRDEHAMCLAADAALRSAEFGRQVGAAIATREGSVIAVGANEVPTAHGGSHWEEDGVGHRDFEIGDVDTNRKQFDELAEKLADHVDGITAEASQVVMDHAAVDPESDVAGWLGAMRTVLREEMPKILRAGGLRDLTEFGRAVHAEMSAVLDATRRGVPTQGATLYCTTFPCHNCARHLVAAGLGRVVFIEPYTKSRAQQLHSDSIAIAPATKVDAKLAFAPFVGVAPRRYPEMFNAESREQLGHAGRKSSDGRRVPFDKHTARPVFSDGGLAPFRPEAREYRWRELLAVEHFGQHKEGSASSVRASGEASATPTEEEGGT